MNNFSDLIHQQIALVAKSETQLLVAYSGGVDSHVLLHCLSQQKKYPVTAIHIDHQIHPDSSQWSVHCQKICSALNIPCVVVKVNIDRKLGESLEAVARAARYKALLSYVDAKTLLLTAQHANDQAETLLLQLCRGAGVAGLAAMPKLKPFGRGQLLRPLLEINRQALMEYAEENHLQWCEDPSNESTQWTRNFIRHDVLPVLTKRWPSITETLSRSSAHCAEAAELIAEWVEMDLKNCLSHFSLPNLVFENTIKIELLEQLSFIRKKHCLREWIYLKTAKYPSENVVLSMIEQLLRPQKSKTPFIQYAQYEIHRFQGFLFFVERNNVTISFENRAVIPRESGGSSTICFENSSVPRESFSAPFKNVSVILRESGGSSKPQTSLDSRFRGNDDVLGFTSGFIEYANKETELFFENRAVILRESGGSSQPQTSLDSRFRGNDEALKKVPGLNLQKLIGKKIEIRYRQGGEKILLPHQTHHKTLKHLFQEWRLPPWLRDQWPLVYCEGELIAVPNFAVAKDYYDPDSQVGFCCE